MKHIKYEIIDSYMTLEEKKQQAWLDLHRAVEATDLDRTFALIKYLLKIRKIEHDKAIKV